MKTLRTLALVLLMVTFSTFAGAADTKDRVEVPAVDVPETMVVQPTSAEIHEDSRERTCVSCHSPNNQDAESKPLNHFLTTKDCGQCHFNKSWIPLRQYSHLSGKYRPNSTPQECASCHTSNSEFLAR
jgi:hypothetical protein